MLLFHLTSCVYFWSVQILSWIWAIAYFQPYRCLHLRWNPDSGFVAGSFGRKLPAAGRKCKLQVLLNRCQEKTTCIIRCSLLDDPSCIPHAWCMMHGVWTHVHKRLHASQLRLWTTESCDEARPLDIGSDQAPEKTNGLLCAWSRKELLNVTDVSCLGPLGFPDRQGGYWSTVASKTWSNHPCAMDTAPLLTFL